MATEAVPSPDGKTWTINGSKLWCTNGLVADVMAVMARTPSKMVNGKEKKQITAFIVEKGTPGIEYASRCDFMGIRAIQNGVIRFNNVKVPSDAILWGEGQGLKLALITLNTGRLTLPRRLGGHEQTGFAHRADLGQGKGAVGPAHRQARGRGRQDRQHGRFHLRAGKHDLLHFRAGG